MLTILFIGLLIVLVFNIIKVAIKLTWGITKIAFSVILFPLVLIGLALAGFFYVALAILIIAGIISFFRNLALS